MTRLAAAATIFAAGLTGLLTNQPDQPAVLPSAAGPVKHRPAHPVRASRSMRRLPLPWTSHRTTPAVKARHRHHAASHVLRAEQPAAANALNWPALAACEAGGNPRAVDPSGTYFGLYQFDIQTWAAEGGHGSPADATPAEQTYRASLLYAQRGTAPWPVCGWHLLAAS